MDDSKIIDLFWLRSENAIKQTDLKYGKYCFSIANHILANTEDAEECVSDTYLSAWNQIPPKRPQILSVFLGKITRNISISRWRARTAEKRGGGEIVLALDELEECIAGPWDIAQTMQKKELENQIRLFCQSLSKEDRIIFLKRYWFLNSIPEISEVTGFTQAKVKSSLYRSKQKLREHLKKEDMYEYR